MTLMERLRNETDPELAEEVLKSAEYVWKHQKNHTGEESRLLNWRVDYFYHAARFHAGRCPVNEPLDVMLDAVHRADLNDYSPDGINHNLTAAAYLFYYAGFLDKAGMRRYAPALDEVRRRAHHYLDKMPGNQYPRLASHAMWELSVMSFGTAEQEICQMLNSLLAGHKPTYVHSLMVAQLTKTLVRQLADTNPEALVGILGCRNAAEVTARRDEICEEAYQCGLYHAMWANALSSCTSASMAAVCWPRSSCASRTTRSSGTSCCGKCTATQIWPNRPGIITAIMMAAAAIRSSCRPAPPPSRPLWMF